MGVVAAMRPVVVRLGLARRRGLSGRGASLQSGLRAAADLACRDCVMAAHLSSGGIRASAGGGKRHRRPTPMAVQAAVGGGVRRPTSGLS